MLTFIILPEVFICFTIEFDYRGGSILDGTIDRFALSPIPYNWIEFLKCPDFWYLLTRCFRHPLSYCYSSLHFDYLCPRQALSLWLKNISWRNSFLRNSIVSDCSADSRRSQPCAELAPKHQFWSMKAIWTARSFLTAAHLWSAHWINGCHATKEHSRTAIQCPWCAAR